MRKLLQVYIGVIAIILGLGALLAFRTHTVEQAEETSGPGVELAVNGGFEEPGSPAPQGWFRDLKQTKNKGEVEQDRTRFHSGAASLKLSPNRHNGGNQPLAIAQIIPGGAYRGKTLKFSGYLSATGGATAVLGVLSVVRGVPRDLVAVTQSSGGSGWTLQQDSYPVPDDPSVQLVLALSVSGQSGAAWFDDVSLTTPGSARAETASRAPQGAVASGPLRAEVDVDTASVIRTIPKTLYGANVEWPWNGNGLWLEQERRLDPKLVGVARDLGVTLIRYPGGTYSDFYHWKNGVGPRENRPEAQHWANNNDRSRANFGTDEALDFARQVGAELLITANAGTGTAQEAADWVRYVNRDSTRVRYWEVGNELYIHDGSPNQKATGVDPSTYANRFRDFARAMRAADPRVKLLAIGGENQGRYNIVTDRDWNRIVLEKAGDQIDLLAVHNAYAPVNASDRQDLRTVYRAMLAAPVLIARNLETVSQQIQQYAPGRASQIGIAVTEWGPLFQLDPRGKYIDHNKTLGSALYAASTMKVFLESSRTQIASAHNLNDYSIMGWIGSRNTSFPPKPDWAPTARAYALQMYTRHFGDKLVRSSTNVPTFNSEAVGMTDAVQNVPYLDVVTSLSADGRQLYVLGINKHFDSNIEATISLRGFAPGPQATAWTLNGTSLDANTGTGPLRVPGMRWGKQEADDRNPRFDRGGPGEVTVSSSTVSVAGAKFTYSFPPHSVTSLVLTRR